MLDQLKVAFNPLCFAMLGALLKAARKILHDVMTGLKQELGTVIFLESPATLLQALLYRRLDGLEGKDNLAATVAAFFGQVRIGVAISVATLAVIPGKIAALLWELCLHSLVDMTHLGRCAVEELLQNGLVSLHPC